MSQLMKRGESLPIRSIDDMKVLSKTMAKSGMCGVDNEAEAMVIVSACHARGIDWLEFVETYHIIQGKPSMRADAQLAAFYSIGGKISIKSRTSELASIVLSLVGHDDVPSSLSHEEAMEEGFYYGKDGTPHANWKTPRKRMQMLWARVVTDGIRVIAPSIVSGKYSPEEIEQFGDENVDAAVEHAHPVEEFIEVEPEPEVDPTICPGGNAKIAGKPFSELPPAILPKILALGEAQGITSAHKAHIKGLLGQALDEGKLSEVEANGE